MCVRVWAEFSPPIVKVTSSNLQTPFYIKIPKKKKKISLCKHFLLNSLSARSYFFRANEAETAAANWFSLDCRNMCHILFTFKNTQKIRLGEWIHISALLCILFGTANSKLPQTVISVADKQLAWFWMVGKSWSTMRKHVNLYNLSKEHSSWHQQIFYCQPLEQWLWQSPQISLSLFLTVFV